MEGPVKRQLFGGSGQMAVIAELLHRKCNAAIPLIDVGTDVFAFREDNDTIARIQVKAAVGKPYKKGQGYSAKFGVPLAQLQREDVPTLYYVLVARLEQGWGGTIVIGRVTLKEMWERGLGSENQKSGDLEIHIQFRRAREENAAESEQKLEATCGTFDLSSHLDAWHILPPLMNLSGGVPHPNPFAQPADAISPPTRT